MCSVDVGAAQNEAGVNDGEQSSEAGADVFKEGGGDKKQITQMRRDCWRQNRKCYMLRINFFFFFFEKIGGNVLEMTIGVRQKCPTDTGRLQHSKMTKDMLKKKKKKPGLLGNCDLLKDLEKFTIHKFLEDFQ